MELRKYDQIMADLAAKKYKPIYFLTGEVPYFVDKISDYIEKNVLNDSEKSFNQTILYGKDSDAVTIMNTAKRFPMMSSHQVVIVKEAQDIKDIDNLIHYIENPLNSTVLVLNYKHKNPDKRKKVFKALAEKSEYFDTGRMYDSEVPSWIAQYVASKNLTIEPKANMLLHEFLGNDLSKIANEVEKLIIALDGKGTTITPALIEQNIGISKDYNNYELQNALGKRDVLKANRIIQYLAENQKNQPIVLTITILHGFFSKVLIYYWLKDKSKDNVARELDIRPFFVKDYVEAAGNYNPNKVIQIISILREYDLKSKGYKGTVIEPGDLLKEMIFKILH